MNSYGEEESIFHCDEYSKSDCNIFEQHAKECSKNLPPWMKKELENTTGLEYQYSFEEDYDLVVEYRNNCNNIDLDKCYNCLLELLCNVEMNIPDKNQIQEAAKLIREREDEK